MHRKRSVYSPPDTHIWLETVKLWPFVLFSTPRCNVSLQRQTEAHLSRLMQSQVQTALWWNYSTHTFLFLSPQNDLFVSCCSQISYACTSYFSTLFSISYWKLEKLFSSGYWLHCSTTHCKQSLKNDFNKLIYKLQCKDRALSLTKTDLNVRASLCLPSGPLNSDLIHQSLTSDCFKRNVLGLLSIYCICGFL